MKSTLHIALFVSLSLLFAACSKEASSEVAAATAATTPPAPPPIPVPAPPTVPGKGYLLMDYASGQILVEHDIMERLEPASLTKIMTAYAVFDALRSGSLKLSDTVTISEHAWRSGGAVTEGSTSFLPVHSQVPVEVLLQGMIVQSGNDASIALAERIAGSEDAFAQLLNSYAKRLGMIASHFENSTGLPSANHFTTAHDMALLSRAIIRDFPQYYHYFSERQYTYNGITQHNRNGLLSTDPSVDGLKTGHTEKAGYCLVTSAKRDDMRLIAVVMGTPSTKARESANAALLNYGFNFFESKQLYAAGQPIGKTHVWKGVEKELSLAAAQPVIVTVPRGHENQLQTKLEIPPSVIAPIAKNATVGTLTIAFDGKTLMTAPLQAQQEVAEAGVFGRMLDSIRMRFE